MKTMAPEDGFLGLSDEAAVSYADARTAIIPFGLESSVTYGTGTAKGPAAILNASYALELFDEDLMSETYRHIKPITLQPPKIVTDIEKALNQLKRMVKKVITDHKLPVVLGGEHAITPAIVQILVEKFGSIRILHIDAHADLRDQYEDNAYSHACAMRRCLDLPDVDIVSCGIRSISAEEVLFWQENQDRVKIYWANDKHNWNISEIASNFENLPVYVSIDVDGFDPSIMPATGTPEPNGLLWNDVVDIVTAVSRTSSIVGVDINELAPIPHFHACDFLVAKLVYKLLGFVFKQPNK
jgi:agmatinase